MKGKIQAILLLLFIPAFAGELLSGSSPPLIFFNQFNFSLLVILYGCGTLLIREARAGWNLQWSVLLLAAAYGILEEGMLVKSFFNPGWIDLGALSGYGLIGGVQWVWSVKVILYHATMSTMIPIAIVDALYPDIRHIPLLGFRGTALVGTGLAGVTVWGAAFMGSGNDSGEPFYAPPLLMLFTLGAVLLLAAAAYLLRKTRVRTRRFPLACPLAFGVCGFVFQALVLVVPELLAQESMPVLTALIVLGGLAAALLLFVFLQLLHRDTDVSRVTALVLGSMLFYVALSPVQEFAAGINPDPPQGMVAVGAVSLALLLLWRGAALRRANERLDAAEAPGGR